MVRTASIIVLAVFGIAVILASGGGDDDLYSTNIYGTYELSAFSAV